MCGIVAYIGQSEALPILVGGLKKLEYRGYDSSGVALIDNDEISTVRASGKISALEAKLKATPVSGSIGIAHTRWATHGAPTEQNAHPHQSFDGKISIVHNGIIENYASLKKRLQADGILFKSETDTEVVTHLIAKFYKGNLKEAVLKALSLIEGTFGLAVICKDEPNTLIGARRGSPLILGIGQNEFFLASDVSAIISHTQKVVYLDDNDVVEIHREKYNLLNTQSQPVQHEVQDVEFDADSIAKGGFAHFMLKEIFEQPEVLRNTMRGRLLCAEGNAKLAGLDTNIRELRNINRIIITACGTSYYAGMVGEYMIEDLAGVPVEVEYASEFRYRNPIIKPGTLVLAISQSGETADTLAALKEAQQKGATALAICNGVGSTIARTSDGGVYLHAGPEIGVASTKAFTSQVTVLAMIALLLGRQRRLSFESGADIVKAMQELPEQVEQTLKLSDQIAGIAQKYVKANNFLYLGRHYNYPVAMEGALKLKEISYIHAEGYPAAEMKHGPIALIDENMPVVVIAPKDALFDKVISNVREIKARGGKVIAITTDDCHPLDEIADHLIKVPKTISMLMPILTCIPLQLMAYHIAVLRGNDVDQPRNLAKSVTVE
ncbi:glucosamine--fructose-6-phosphate aminotransferase (isomerizing) [Fibrobacter sp. UWH9]|uniref:glutamine--fructose-6-phosphate transaminase (isomerizing) n=1 Tax=unclassified Fibrobacter TaxID=2634177 RepID=UPI00091437C9|nr:MULTISPECIES: glutamine--fructose-6-phosphate transaminase (isomerizing) [unclassified Fibrobacter]MCQ2100167.1 glutamine--fructose-6-phosphate transaminase (isomerizing) [Fibrobacter sp.]MDO4946098.1 glutamine--fructose-6-phosphate transaminase (isomerizing) [Fibrobacter sp.]OWV04787.1 glutamine--fructose-6-phosphate transaminase (isomerizing) [Fibrobacter sp. UWH3]OWV13835.1 glutamine--fructose-6-phosphate transaminase (isomerizing) [Fibrobacter sp. UWH1]SHG66684.1 glucosamine--fructose-6